MVMAALLAGCGTMVPATSVAPHAGLSPEGPIQEARLLAVSDGDTIRVQIGGVEYRVRYIGIDAPELGDDPEPFGQAARQANADLLREGAIVLEKDVSETDRFGRLLRHVWVRDGSAWLLVNLELVRQGMARAGSYPPDVRYTDSLYRPAEREAREAERGLWGQ
jgi:micrococcal nuclease